MPSPSVVYEDEDVLVLDKPAGEFVSTGRGKRKASLTLMDRWRATHGEGVSNAHRLDAEVSGVVVCARNKIALDRLTGQFQSKSVKRTHGALVIVSTLEEARRICLVEPSSAPIPADEFSIGFALGPDQHDADRMHVYRRKGGRPALSRFRVLERFGRYAWVEAIPETSREHQLQAHLASVGFPVLGDAVYGLPDQRLMLSELKRGYKGRATERPLLDRLALHLHEVTLKHPTSGETLTFTSDWPKEFEVALRNLRKFARS